MGRFHACVLVRGGAVLCWGGNAFGQLGDGTTVNRATPAPVADLEPVARLAAGSIHTCAVTVGGRVLCWGSNADGQLGDGSTVSRPRPEEIRLPASRAAASPTRG